MLLAADPRGPENVLTYVATGHDRTLDAIRCHHARSALAISLIGA